jgi:hypothetical protein
VQLAAIPATVLELAGASPPGDPVASPLPLSSADAEPPAQIVSEWTDPANVHERDEQRIVRVHRLVANKNRKDCKPRHRAFGNMRSLIRYPHQLIRYDDFEPSLFDLRDDPTTRRDLHRSHPALTQSLTEALAATNSAPVVTTPAPTTPLPKEVEDQLRALGYVD